MSLEKTVENYDGNWRVRNDVVIYKDNGSFFSEMLRRSLRTVIGTFRYLRVLYLGDSREPPRRKDYV